MSLTQIAVEGLKRFVFDSVSLPSSLLTLIVQYCIPFTVFVVTDTRFDENGNKVVYEFFREERDDIWALKDFTDLLENTAVKHTEFGHEAKLELSSSQPPTSLEELLVRLEESDNVIALTIQHIDLSRNRQKRCEAGTWSDWLPINLYTDAITIRVFEKDKSKLLGF
jgi:hypothetical protein